MCPKIAEMGVRLWHVCSWCARWRILRCGGFAAISQLRNECTRLPNGTRVPKSGFATAKYSSKWSFGCEIGIFHVLGFRNHFAAAKWGSLCCEMRFTVLRNGTHVPKCASQPRNTLRNGALAVKLGIFTLWSFAAAKQLRNGGSCAGKWHSCAKIGFAAAKIFVERGLRLRTGFAAKCRFCRGCEISQTPVFPLFLLCFRSDFAPKDFLQFLCNSSWFWSSKNLYYIKTNRIKALKSKLKQVKSKTKRYGLASL